MQPGADERRSFELTRLLAFGWAAALAFVWLFRYDAWMVPAQFVNVARAALPTWHPGPHFGEFWFARAREVVSVLAIGAGAFAIGAVTLCRLRINRPLLDGLFALAAGCWILAVAALVLGVFSVRFVPLPLFSLLFWLFPAPRNLFSRPATAVRLDAWEKFLLACLLIAALLNLFGAFAPPFEYDELEYHLGALADYQRAGRIVFLPHNFYSNLPQLTEMLYLIALQTSGATAAKLMHWNFGMLTALATFAFARQWWSRRVAITAAALIYCLPFVQDLSQTARIDLATTFFATLAFGALILTLGREGEASAEPQVLPTARREARPPGLWLAALAAGCAVATKWTAVAVVVLPSIVFLAIKTRYLRLSSVFCLLSSLLVVPWLVKNWFFTGNPVYPLLDHLFRSPHWSAMQTALFAEKHFARFDLAGLRQLGEAPWRDSFSEGGAAPLLLMTAPLLVLVRSADKPVRRTAWLFGAAFAGWFLLTFRPWRFLFPALPLAALVGAYAVEALGKWTRAVLGATIVVALALIGLTVLIDEEELNRIPPRFSFVNLALGQISAEDFVAHVGRESFEPIVWMNHNLPADAKVLWIGEARAFDARQTPIWGTAFDRHPLEDVLRKPTDAARLATALRARGIRYIYVNFSEWERLRSHYNYLLGMDNNAFRNLLQHDAHEIHAHGRSGVWELNAE